MKESEFTPLNQARIITDAREPFEVYIDLVKLNLRREFTEKYKSLKPSEIDVLVENSFYITAYEAYLEDYGGVEETNMGIAALIKVNQERSILS